jgi:hypothetical protein
MMSILTSDKVEFKLKTDKTQKIKLYNDKRELKRKVIIINI